MSSIWSIHGIIWEFESTPGLSYTVNDSPIFTKVETPAWTTHVIIMGHVSSWELPMSVNVQRGLVDSTVRQVRKLAFENFANLLVNSEVSSHSGLYWNVLTGYSPQGWKNYWNASIITDNANISAMAQEKVGNVSALTDTSWEQTNNSVSKRVPITLNCKHYWQLLLTKLIIFTWQQWGVKFLYKNSFFLVT